MKLFHQCGHCTNWNLAAFEEEGCGDGLIFSPVHEKRARIEGVSRAIRRASFFDPQYYLPNSQKPKLHTFDFFPEVIADGYSTVDFSLVAIESAKMCLGFQLEQDFDRIIIPAKYFSQMDPSFTEKQDAYTVIPFLKEASRLRIKKPIFLTLPLTSHMICNGEYRTKILNWVTSYPEIDGIYLIPDYERQTKQIQSKEFLTEMLRLLVEVQEAELKVLVGYSNTECLLYLITGDIEITFGSFENTRMFSLDKFLQNDEIRQGPKARIYLPGLLNWIQYSQAVELRQVDEEIWSEAYSETSHGNAALDAAVEPTFNQPMLYRHYFSTFSEQVAELESLSPLQRYQHIRTWLKDAINLNRRIEDIPIDFERHGQGGHLQPWLDVINTHYTKYLKE